MRTEVRKAEFFNRMLLIFLGLLFLAYCLIYLFACPSRELALACGAEFVGLFLSVIIMRSGFFKFSFSRVNSIPMFVRNSFSWFENLLSSIRLVLLSLLSMIALVDFTALLLSVLGFYAPAVALYCLMPFSYWLGLHPALSLEMLAGAFVQKGDYLIAEPLYDEVMQVRVRLSGDRSDLCSAVYADIGDLNVRKNDLLKAEEWYRKSIELGPRTGRGYTALATVLRERGQFEESKLWYLKALELRKKVYGSQSKQYGDTERAYRRLLQLEQKYKDRNNSASPGLS